MWSQGERANSTQAAEEVRIEPETTGLDCVTEDLVLVHVIGPFPSPTIRYNWENLTAETQ